MRLTWGSWFKFYIKVLTRMICLLTGTANRQKNQTIPAAYQKRPTQIGGGLLP